MDVKPTGDDITTMMGIILGATIETFMFVFINFKNIASSAFEEIKLFEYEQDKTMFNSLQEGVIVIDSPSPD